jgi:hypothetical protein
LRPPKPESEDVVFFDVIFLRHPLDRLRSMYDFYSRSEQRDDPLVECAHRLQIGAFMELLLCSYPHLANDAQVNCLANQARYTRPPDQNDLQKATGIFARAALAGVTEMFELSMRAARYFTSPGFGSLDLTHPAENVSAGRDKTLQERLSRMEERCGPAIYQALLKANQLDLQLLQKAEAEIRRRLSCIPSLLKDASEERKNDVEAGAL